jgi:hypothetical protein
MNNNDNNRVKLISNWQKNYGHVPPKGLSRHTLELSTAYHRQSLKHGRLAKSAVTQLIKIAKLGKDKVEPSALSNLAKPGARLIREWHGQTYVVDILESGYLWRETIYKSLTEIAREITGTQWSGPRFFGLRHRK